MSQQELDPEWIQIRNEFAESLDSRKKDLLALQGTLEKEESFEKLFFIVHRIAGCARMYGYEVLGRVSEKLDDDLTHIKFGSEVKIQEVSSCLESEILPLMLDVLSEAISNKEDSGRLQDVRLKSLQTALHLRPKPGQ